MRLATLVFASLVAVPLATAKPLPKGMKIEVRKGRAMVTMGGPVVSVTGDTLADWESVTGELSDDGKEITISGTRCKSKLTGDQTKQKVTLQQIEAKFENADGETVMAKKKYEEASGYFAAAMAMDPTVPLYASNLLVAQVKNGKLEDADKTINTAGKQHVAWFAWRVAVDPALASIKSRASVKKVLHAATPGKARSPTLADAFAISPFGLAATRTASGEGGSGAEFPSELSFTDIASGREVLRLPIGKGGKVVDAEQALVDKLLVQLGFTFEGMFQDIRQGRSHSTNDGRAMLVTERGITFQKGSLKEPVTMPNIIGVGFMPGGALFVTRYEHVFRCDDKSYRTELHSMADPVPAPPPKK